MPKKRLKDPELLDSAIQQLMQRYKERIRAKGKVFTLKYDEFKKLVQSDCTYCGVSYKVSMRTSFMDSWEYYRNTIDRVDSAKGYTSDNCVPACIKCNSDKSDYNVIEWLQWVHAVAKHTENYPGLKEAGPIDHRKFIGKFQLRESNKRWAIDQIYQRSKMRD